MVYDVAILGYGPTGATLANLLAAQGVSVLVLDRENAFYHLPRAVHFDDEIMRVFQTVGIADELSKKVYVNPGMKFIDDDDQLLLDWPRPREITPHGWNASYRLHQPDLEKLLREKLASQVGVKIRTGFYVSAIEEKEECVFLHGTDRSTGEVANFEARYLVGCDGANSLTRRAIDGEMEDLGFDERWLVVDVLLKRPKPELGDHSVQFCNPNRPMTYCRGPANRRRWEITVKDHETDEEILDPKRVWKFLSRWISPQDADLERRAVYTFRSQLADIWRKGRILIAGDAAHLTPPFMGQGMCTGIRDASNLAWKLIACLGGAHERLLDAYQAERAPHARTYVETAMRLGGLINALDREKALQMAQDRGDGGAKMRSITPRLGASTVLTAELAHEVGRPFGQIDLGKGQRDFDDHLGYTHVIISAAPPANLPQNVRWLPSDASEQLAAEMRRLDAKALWIRPDRYIGAVSQNAECLVKTLHSFHDIKDENQNEACLA